MQELWPGLTCFLDNPLIPLDNNAVVELALRGLGVGRKNHYGSHSRRGCEVAALFYSLMETAKLCGVEPKSYLLHATSEALEGNLVRRLSCLGLSYRPASIVDEEQE